MSEIIFSEILRALLIAEGWFEQWLDEENKYHHVIHIFPLPKKDIYVICLGDMKVIKAVKMCAYSLRRFNQSIPVNEVIANMHLAIKSHRPYSNWADTLADNQPMLVMDIYDYAADKGQVWKEQDGVKYFGRKQIVNSIYRCEDAREHINRMIPKEIIVDFEILYEKILLEKLLSLPIGNGGDNQQKDAKEYQLLIRDVFKFILYDYGVRIKVENRKYDESSRQDIIIDISQAINNDYPGFGWDWFKSEYECKWIVVDCKNSKDKTEIIDGVEQIEKYLDDGSFGRFGVLVARDKGNVEKNDRYQRCLKRGNKNKNNMILILDDNDIKDMLKVTHGGYVVIKNYRVDGVASKLQRMTMDVHAKI